MLNLMNVKVPSNSEILGFSCEVITSGALADAPKQTTEGVPRRHEIVSGSSPITRKNK